MSLRSWFIICLFLLGFFAYNCFGFFFGYSLDSLTENECRDGE